jgi:hypothetical protein
MVESDADLEDAVIETADGRARVAPEELERLVLLEELARVELLDAVDERLWRRIGAAGAGRFVWCACWFPLRRARRLARAATGFGRARIR